MHLQLLDGVLIFLAGLIVGIFIGATWERAYEMVRSGIIERHQRYRSSGPMNPFARAHQWMREKLGAVGFVLLLNCLVWITIGAFQLYTYNTAKSFANCQADYNQKSAIARDARIGVTDKENDLLFKALQDALVRQPVATPAEEKAHQVLIRAEFQAAVQAHEDRLRSAKLAPYPPNPDVTCGSN